MNIPNVLTLSRIVLAMIMVLLLQQGTLAGTVLAAVVFTIASLTDFCDGHLAKKKGLVSDFGKIMDPVADKILLLSAFWVLATIEMVPWWMVVVIAIREVAVTVSRLLIMRKGQVLAAEGAGKIKTVMQITAVSSMLLYLIAEQSGYGGRQGLWVKLNYILMLAAVAVTVYSGIDYYAKYRAPSLIKKGPGKVQG